LANHLISGSGCLYQNIPRAKLRLGEAVNQQFLATGKDDQQTAA